MIETAVILAAGCGTRLDALGTRIPKGFIRLGEKPIVEESVARLMQAGIERIVIVTGHLVRHYRELADRLGVCIRLVHNPCYADSGSMYSLSLARGLLANLDFLLLESDLIYQQKSLSALLGHAAEDVLLCSGPTASGDEVYVEADGCRLVNLSKNRSQLGQTVIGEMVGITRISAPLYRLMLASADDHFRRSLHMEYERALVSAGAGRPIDCLLIGDLLWAEIDDASHLDRATRLIYPRIVACDGAG